MVVRVADHFWERLVNGIFVRGRGVNLDLDTDDRAHGSEANVEGARV